MIKKKKTNQEKIKLTLISPYEIRDIYLRFWTIDHVHNLNYLTILLYFIVWSKFYPRVMKAANGLDRFLMQDWIVALMDRKEKKCKNGC